LESQVSAAEQAAESTITGLQSQANQAWTDYLATLAPGETPTVTQQPSLDMSLAMLPGLSSAVMASLLGGPPASNASTQPLSQPSRAALLTGQIPTGASLVARYQRASAASDVHGFWYYLFHPWQGEGPGYSYYLNHPSQMDRDLRYGFYGMLTFAGVAGGVASGGMIYCGPAAACPTIATALGVGGAAAGGGGAVNSVLTITFGHGARHLVGTGLTQAQVEAAIALWLQAIGAGVGAFWGWIQVNGQWLQYRVHVLQNGIINVGTYFPVSGPFTPK
jgi:hypothetical protein